MTETLSRRRFRSLSIALCCAAFGWADSMHGQEAIRVSQAAAQADEAHKQAAATLGYYNLKVGPTAWHFTARTGLELVDNAELTQNDPKADVILTPQLNTSMRWPLTELNTLNLNLGA